jgi:hypothetical protein
MSKPAPASTEVADDQRYTVFFRFPDLKRALRATADGRTTNRKVHAAILTRAEAERVIELSRPYLDEHHPGTRMWIAPF